jgi:pimeloyl-ACP methyl ester carboxylesterase
MASSKRRASRPSNFTERFAKVNGVRLRYLAGGQGSPVILLHGYAETSHMWRPLMPVLAQQHRVVVPDLRGAGGSAKPTSGYDKKTMAVDIYELASSLELGRVRIVGHDIGLMVGAHRERRVAGDPRFRHQCRQHRPRPLLPRFLR